MSSEEFVGDIAALAPDAPVFTVSDVAFTWVDVVSAARLTGEWREVEREATRGLACLRRSEASGETPPKEAVSNAERDFRRARRLLSGEATIAWLEQRRLTLADWRDYLRRVIARRRSADELAETVERFPVPRDEVEAVLWAEAVCSGFIEEAARRLAVDAALAVEAGESVIGDHRQVLARIEAAAELKRREVLTEDAVAQTVAGHELEWTRVEGRLLELPTEDIAREAAYLVRDDGRSLESVAAECGVDLTPLRVYMGEADSISPVLLAAHVGEVAGPFPFGERVALVAVDAKTRPTVSDPEVRHKAETLVVERAARRAVSTHVIWHEPA